MTLLCVARTALPHGHDDGHREGGHQEAGDVLQSTTEGGLPSESDGEGDTDVVALDDKIQVQDQPSLESVEEGNMVGLYNYQVKEIKITVV